MSTDAERLLLDHLATIERAIAFTCRRGGLEGADAEDFASTVKLRLVENGYSILRRFEGRSSFSSFISVVVQRMLSDERNHLWGKWHSSAEAKRLGPLAIDVEKMLLRDGRSMDEALPALGRNHPGITRQTVERIVARLPQRAPRRRLVELDETEVEARGDASPREEPAIAAERERTSERVSRLVRDLLAAIPGQELLVLQLHFEGGMSVAQIARSLHLDQKLLYRRIERQLRGLREALMAAGVEAKEALELLESHVSLDFSLGNPAVRPSTDAGAVGTGQKESSE